MQPIGQAQELRLTSALADIDQLYPWLDRVAANAPIAADVLSRMHVVLEEAVANAARHGFGPAGAGQIVIRFACDRKAARLEIEDNGIAFDPVTAPIPDRASSLADAVPGGLGLLLIRRFCQSIAYVRRGEVNHLTMRFPLDQPP